MRLSEIIHDFDAAVECDLMAERKACSAVACSKFDFRTSDSESKMNSSNSKYFLEEPLNN